MIMTYYWPWPITLWATAPIRWAIHHVAMMPSESPIMTRWLLTAEVPHRMWYMERNRWNRIRMNWIDIVYYSMIQIWYRIYLVYFLSPSKTLELFTALWDPTERMPGDGFRLRNCVGCKVNDMFWKYHPCLYVHKLIYTHAKTSQNYVQIYRYILICIYKIVYVDCSLFFIFYPS